MHLLAVIRSTVMIILAIALCACDDANWGELASSFVDSDVPGLSKSYASAHLTEIWNASLVETDTNSVVTAKELAAEITADPDVEIDNLSALSAAALLDRFNQADAIVGRLIDVGVQVQSVAGQVRNPEDFCNSRALFFSQGLANVGVVGPFSLIAPKLGGARGAWTIGVTWTADGSGGGQDGSNYVQGAVQLAQAIGGIFSKTAAEQQNEILDEAISRLPQRALQSNDAFALSQKVCASAAAVAAEKDIHSTAKTAILTLAPLLTSRRKDAVLRRELIGSYLRPLETQAFLQSAGVSNELSTFQQEVTDGEVSTQAALLIRSVQRSTATLAAQTQCLPKLRAAEDLEDAASEAQAQLKVFKGVATQQEDLNLINGGIRTMSNIIHNMPDMRKSVAKNLCA